VEGKSATQNAFCGEIKRWRQGGERGRVHVKVVPGHEERMRVGGKTAGNIASESRKSKRILNM